MAPSSESVPWWPPDMVAPTKKAGAIAIMFTGLTAANVLGVPFGTMLGQAAGWRSTFWAITVIGVIALAGILALVPKTGHGDTAPGSCAANCGAFRSGQVWLSILVTILGYGGMFGAFTYIAYTLTEVSGFAASTVPWLLIVFGVGLFIGNTVGGKAADRNVDRTLIVVLAVLVVVLVGFALTAGNQVLTVASIVLMGGFGFATVPGLQMRVMKYAASAPTLASGANIGAFNVGNALGAWLGGVTITAGLGYTSPIWAGAGITLLGLARDDLRRRRRQAERGADPCGCCPHSRCRPLRQQPPSNAQTPSLAFPRPHTPPQETP